MSKDTEAQEPMDAIGDAWDALHEDTRIICMCDGCNHYSPTYNPALTCALEIHVARLAGLLTEATA